jgi:hypothetical protein
MPQKIEIISMTAQHWKTYYVGGKNNGTVMIIFMMKSGEIMDAVCDMIIEETTKSDGFR